jgi:hypothetical protein
MRITINIAAYGQPGAAIPVRQRGKSTGDGVSQNEKSMTARKLYTYAGSFLPSEVADTLHDVSDVIQFMAENGYRDAMDSTTGFSARATAPNGLTVCVNGYVSYDNCRHNLRRRVQLSAASRA